MAKIKDEIMKPYTLRISETVHRKLKAKSASEGLTMRAVVERLIKDYVAKK